jgi:hypothetical protein
MQACHTNGNKTDNSLSNLRWDTPANNSADKDRHGTHLRGERSPRAKLTEQEVLEIHRLRASGQTLVDIGQQFGVHPRHVGMIVKRRRWKHVA